VSEQQIKKAKSFNGWVSIGGLLTLLILSEIIYLLLLQLDAVNGWTPVLTFWLEMGALFIFYGLAVWLVKRSDKFKKSILFLIILGTVLFRLILLPAGLPFDATTSEKLTALQTDLYGQEVTYERFQLFDNDIWRYLWDGHIWANAVNPYKYAPVDSELDKFSGDSTVLEEEVLLDEEFSTDETLEETPNTEIIGNETIFENETAKDKLSDELNPRWLDIRENVNHAEVTTIYPPLMQSIFWVSYLIAPGSVLMMKIVLVFCELIGILFLALALKRLEMPVSLIILYGWNPLMIKVFAGSGHADSVLVMMICVLTYFVIRQAKTLVAISFGLAILAKLSPIFLLPFVVRRIGWWRSLLIIAVVFLGYLPFIDAGQNLFSGFLKFAREWQFNAGLFTFLRWFFELFVENGGDLARNVCAILILAVIVGLVWKDDLSDKVFLKSVTITLGILVIFSPTVMPWYLSWVLPIAVLAKQNVWFYFSAIVLAAFHIIIDQNEYAIVLFFEYSLLLILFLWEFRKNKVQILPMFNVWQTRQKQI
jgi:alpha-1,6-mannosyltransferase